jgi:hypothetical protein
MLRAAALAGLLLVTARPLLAQEGGILGGVVLAVPSGDLRSQAGSTGGGFLGEFQLAATPESHLSLGADDCIFGPKTHGRERAEFIGFGLISGTRLGRTVSGFVGLSAEHLHQSEGSTTKPSFRAGVEYPFPTTGVRSRLYLTHVRAWNSDLTTINLAVLVRL